MTSNPKSISEHVYDVHWEGPFKVEDLEQFDKDPALCLYSVYSAHPLYGRSVLVYIGMTEQDTFDRLVQHDWWTSAEAEHVSVHVGSIGSFTNWQAATAAQVYPRPDRKTIEAVESLLIYAHQPAYNIRSTRTADGSAHLRLFNTGRFGSLLPEVSGMYYVQSYLKGA